MKDSFSKTCTKRLIVNSDKIDSSHSDNHNGCSKGKEPPLLQRRINAAKSLCFENCAPKSEQASSVPLPSPSFAHFPLVLTSTPNRACIPKRSSRIDLASSVKLSVQYESKTVNKILPKEYEALGKALAHGPAQRITKAIFKCIDLKKLVVEKVLRLVGCEASHLCSTKTPSLLRQTGKADMVNFSFESLCEEWKTKAPIFYAFLMTVANSKDATWLPSVAVAGATLLKQRNTRMNAVAATLGIMMKTRSIEVTLIPSIL